MQRYRGRHYQGEYCAGNENRLAYRLTPLSRKDEFHYESNQSRENYHKKASPPEKIDATGYTRQQCRHYTPVNGLFSQYFSKSLNLGHKRIALIWYDLLSFSCRNTHNYYGHVPLSHAQH
jgi:hypothetical protein